MMLPSPFDDKTPQVVFINGMGTKQAVAEQYAQQLQSGIAEPVLLIYDSYNAFYDGVRAKLGIIDPPTKRLVDIVHHAIAQQIPLIISAQSLGTIKAQNAARIVVQQRYREWYARGVTAQQARANAIGDLSIVTWIFTGNTIWWLALYLSGYLVHNIGDPLTRAFGSHRGTPRMHLITIQYNPTGKPGDQHRYVHHLPTVTALIRTTRHLHRLARRT